MTLEATPILERIFGLSVVGGRRTVRPGEVTTFRFCSRNTSETATPPARLVLVLPPGWSALDALEAALPPIAPGTERAVSFRARPDIADAETAESPVQAALYLDTLVLGSNVVHMRVAGRPRFNASAGGVRIEPAGDGTLRVTVTVVNEGDAAARAVRVVAPPPPGFAADETAIAATCDELAAGETLKLAYTMLPIRPVAAIVCIDDAYVAFDGGRAALATVASALLGADIAPPDIVAERRASRLDLRVRVANAGWVAARDVRCTLELPAGWRVVRGTMLADGAPAAVRRDGDTENGVGVTLPLVPARGAVELTVVASASRPRVGGDIVVSCGDRKAVAPVPDVALRALRIDARPESAFAEPAGSVPIAVDVQNIGETTERVSVGIAGETCWTGELRAGAAAAFVARHRMPPELRDGETATISVVATATGAAGVEPACAQFDLRAVDRPWIAIDDIVWERGLARLSVRNAGATVARDVRIAGDSGICLAALPPGETHEVTVDSALARDAALTCRNGAGVPIGRDEQNAAAGVSAALTIASRARSGERLDVRMRLTGDGAVQTLRVCPRADAAAAYVAGSTSINGHAVVDGPEGPPLFSGDGLTLHVIPAGTVVELCWSVLPRTPGQLIVAVDVVANGIPVDVTPAIVAVAGLPPFGARPDALPFHIDAWTVGDCTSAASAAGIGALPAEPAPSEPEGFRLDCEARPIEPEALRLEADVLRLDADGLRLPRPQSTVDDGPAGGATQKSAHTKWPAPDAARATAFVRVLRGARGPGLLGHLPSLAVLVPHTVASGDPDCDGAFAAASKALRGVYERLFVKLRIPSYAVTPADLEDVAMRRALLALLERLAEERPTRHCDSERALLDRISDGPMLAGVSQMRDALAGSAPGGPHTLIAVAALVPREGVSDAAAVNAYERELAAAFDAACARARAHTPAQFCSYLAQQRTPELDAARVLAIAALDARAVAVAKRDSRSEMASA